MAQRDLRPGLTKQFVLGVARVDLQKARLSLADRTEAEIIDWIWEQAFEAGRLDGGDAGYMTGLEDARAEQYTQLELPLIDIRYLAPMPDDAINPYADELAQGNHD